MIFCFLIIFISSCTTSYFLKPELNDDNDEIVYIDGKEVIISHSVSFVVALYGYISTNSELIFHVLFKNIDPKNRYNIIPEDIQVIGYNSQGISKSFKVYSADEYIKKIRNSQTLALAFQAMAGSMEAYQAGKQTNNTYGSLYGSDGTSYSGYSSSTTFDYSAQAEANARNNAELQKTASQYSQIRSSTEQGLLKANTVFPDQVVEGNIVVKIDQIYTLKYEVLIPAGNDIHRVIFLPTLPQGKIKPEIKLQTW